MSSVQVEKTINDSQIPLMLEKLSAIVTSTYYYQATIFLANKQTQHFELLSFVRNHFMKFRQNILKNRCDKRLRRVFSISMVRSSFPPRTTSLMHRAQKRRIQLKEQNL